MSGTLGEAGATGAGPRPCSVVIPVFNGAATIGRCLEALLAGDHLDTDRLVLHSSTRTRSLDDDFMIFLSVFSSRFGLGMVIPDRPRVLGDGGHREYERGGCTEQQRGAHGVGHDWSFFLELM